MNLENTTVIENFIKIANNFPNRTALSVNEQNYSYSKILNKVNLISKNLLSLSKKEKIIAIIMDRSFLQITSLLACLKSDKSFIILDEKIPLNKKKIIQKKLKIKTVLLDNIKKKIKSKGIKFLNKNKILKKNNSNLMNDTYKNDIVYYVYTSGSTGEPKGVQINNINLLNFISGCQKIFKFTKKDKFILLPYLSFDLSVFPLWNSLIAGSTLYYPNGSDILYPFNYIKKNKISVYCSVPSQIDIITNILKKQKFSCSSIRLSVFCGEPLKYYQIFQWKKYFKKSKNFNTYGPSETTCFNTFFEVKKINNEKLSEVISIGKPMPSNTIQLKNKEIVISGKQVSKGYVDQTFNKGKFIFKGKKIIYRTGDYAKKKGGNYFFLGRRDKQIKISGYRVELGDIEKNISKALNNKNVLAFYKKNKIFAVVENDSKLNGKQQQIIEKNLAKHMIPKKIFFLPKFPLNKNMKIDNKIIIKKFKNEY